MKRYLFAAPRTIFTDIAIILMRYSSYNTLPPRPLKHALLSRTNNSYGKDPKELAAILGYWKEYEQKYTATAHMIDCTEPLSHVVDKITAVTL